MESQPTNQPRPSISPHQQETDDFRAASQAASEEYDNYTKHGAAYITPRHGGRKVLLVVLVVLLFLGVGTAAYWFLVRKDDIHTKTSSSGYTTHQTTPAGSTTKGSAITTATEHYVSPGFGLEFDHPKDWTASEPTGSGVLTVKSPSMTLKNASGQTFSGQVVLTVRNKQQPLPEFDKGNAVATVASQKLTYAHPSQTQRGSTYLSFLTYASSGQSGGLDGLYITGDVGYQKGQAIPKADFTPVDPVISVTFVKCTGKCGADSKAASIDPALWQSDTFGKPLTDLLESLVIS